MVDGLVLEESGLEIDESLLTGEADPVLKSVGETVMSGSFVVAGTGAYRATKVGRDAYAASLTAEASKLSLARSELRAGINQILKLVTYLLIPAGLLVIYTQLFTTRVGWQQSVLRTVGALVPMVPEGLVLMTSIAFAVGVVRLGRRQCLVQELPAIEGLARVDVVCADKTGTLTENRMKLAELRPLDSANDDEYRRRCAGVYGRRGCSPQRQHPGDRRGLPQPAGLDCDRDRAVQVGDEVEWCILYRAWQLGSGGAGRAAGPLLAGCRAGRSRGFTRVAGAASRVDRPGGRPS